MEDREETDTAMSACIERASVCSCRKIRSIVAEILAKNTMYFRYATERRNKIGCNGAREGMVGGCMHTMITSEIGPLGKLL